MASDGRPPSADADSCDHPIAILEELVDAVMVDLVHIKMTLHELAAAVEELNDRSPGNKA